MARSQRLPPGQTRTEKFPLVGEQEPLAEALDPARWRLVVDGAVACPLSLSYEEVLALPQDQLVADIHCVTGWSHFDMTFGGIRLRVLLDRAEPLPAARFVRFAAYSARHHDTSLPLDLARHDTWLIHSRDGAPLTPAHGFPLRTVTPSRYFYKSLKWVHRIELLREDRLGYWERESAYHNRGDPWPGDQRFTTGSIDPQRLARFRNATRFAPYRGPRKVMISADLSGWEPRTRDLGALHLKNCNLRGARLDGVDLRHANLSLSDLQGASLQGADLRHADLEGVDFTNADLRHADLRHTLLSATRFTTDGGEGANVTGLRWEGASGLLESQEAYLLRHSGDQEES